MTDVTRNTSNWKSQVYITGAAVGTLFGLLSAYMYARAAAEEAEHNGGHPPTVSTGEMIGLALASLGIMRQITELGRPDRKQNKR